MPFWSVEGLQTRRKDGSTVNITEALLDVATNLGKLERSLSLLAWYTAATYNETKAIREKMERP